MCVLIYTNTVTGTTLLKSNHISSSNASNPIKQVLFPQSGLLNSQTHAHHNMCSEIFCGRRGVKEGFFNNCTFD